MSMRSLDFDNGIRTFAINGDESNVIRVSVSDANMMTRYENAKTRLDEIAEKFRESDEGGDSLAEALTLGDRELRSVIDCIFGDGTSEHAFGGVNCLSAVSGGRFLFEAFLEALIPEIAREVESFAAARAERYTAEVIGETK